MGITAFSDHHVYKLKSVFKETHSATCKFIQTNCKKYRNLLLTELKWEWHKIWSIQHSDIWCYEWQYLTFVWMTVIRAHLKGCIEWWKRSWCNLAEPKAIVLVHIPSNRTCSFLFSLLISWLYVLFPSCQCDIWKTGRLKDYTPRWQQLEQLL